MPMTERARDSAATRRAAAARRVADLVRSDLRAGHFGEQLPYEWDLLRRYACSRAVLRDGLGRLRDEGVLRRVRGVGTLRDARATPVDLALHATPGWLTAPSAGRGGAAVDGHAMVETLSVEQLGAPAPVAEALGTTPGSPVVFTESLVRSAAGRTRCGRAGPPTTARLGAGSSRRTSAPSPCRRTRRSWRTSAWVPGRRWCGSSTSSSSRGAARSSSVSSGSRGAWPTALHGDRRRWTISPSFDERASLVTFP